MLNEFEKELHNLCLKYGVTAGVYAKENGKNACIYLVSEEEELNEKDFDILVWSLQGFMIAVMELSKNKNKGITNIIDVLNNVLKRYTESK